MSECKTPPKFRDKTHEILYYDWLERMNNNDCYHQAFAYLISLDVVTRTHINRLYSFQEGCIKPDGLDEAWQTGTSMKTTRLAFNLWNGYAADESKVNDHPDRYAVAEIFCCEYAPYYWQAVQLRFPEYAQ